MKDDEVADPIDDAKGAGVEITMSEYPQVDPEEADPGSSMEAGMVVESGKVVEADPEGCPSPDAASSGGGDVSGGGCPTVACSEALAAAGAEDAAPYASVADPEAMQAARGKGADRRRVLRRKPPAPVKHKRHSGSGKQSLPAYGSLDAEHVVNDL